MYNLIYSQHASLDSINIYHDHNKASMKLIKSSTGKLVTWKLWRWGKGSSSSSSSSSGSGSDSNSSGGVGGSGVYVVAAGDPYHRAMLFLRYQEYFESPYKKFYRRHFKLLDFMDHYRSDRGEDAFLYPRDWGGYNLPGEYIEACAGGILDYNSYDEQMGKILQAIKSDSCNKFYLIGVDEVGSGLMDHELAHAFYYLDSSYKRGVNSLFKELDSNKVDRMKELLLGWGYRGGVLRDEMQAYLSTGLVGEQGRIFSKRDCIKFTRYFKEYVGNRV